MLQHLPWNVSMTHVNSSLTLSLSEICHRLYGNKARGRDSISAGQGLNLVVDSTKHLFSFLL